MNPDWITLAGIIAIIWFLWNLHRDVAELRERMARMEGSMEVLAGNVATLLGESRRQS